MLRTQHVHRPVIKNLVVLCFAFELQLVSKKYHNKSLKVFFS